MRTSGVLKSLHVLLKKNRRRRKWLEVVLANRVPAAATLNPCQRLVALLLMRLIGDCL